MMPGRYWSPRANRWYTLSDPVGRFWAKVHISDGCWDWTGATRRGYGTFKLDGRHQGTHRIAWEWANGPVPEGLVLDHLCRNRRCVNPAHLEPVTTAENLLRGDTLNSRNAVKTHCPKGHPLLGDNLYAHAGRRGCVTCRREQSQRHRERVA